MKRLIPLLLVIIILLCGCSSDKKDIITYDLAVCDTNMTDLCSYLDSMKSENFLVEKMDFSAQNFSGFIATLEENSTGINSITLYGKGVTDETAAQFIEFASKKEIPVLFAFSEISTDVLTSYDKAFCLTTNYTHAAEITSKKIKEVWTSSSLVDADDNKLFKFATIKNAELSSQLQAFYDTLIAGIELYGVPMEINPDISSEEVVDGETITALNENTEALIVIDSNIIPYIKDYTPYGSGIELISISEGTENILADSPYVLNCFVDYKKYKLAADEIISNYNNRQFPLINLSFPHDERTVYIPATV